MIVGGAATLDGRLPVHDLECVPTSGAAVFNRLELWQRETQGEHTEDDAEEARKGVTASVLALV